MLLKDEKVLVSIIGERFWSALVIVLFFILFFLSELDVFL